MENRKELALEDLEEVNGAGAKEFFETILEYLLPGMTNAD